jgi:hypothetical protein
MVVAIHDFDGRPNPARHGRSLRQPVRDGAARSPAAALTVGLRPGLPLMGGARRAGPHHQQLAQGRRWQSSGAAALWPSRR